MQRSIIQGSRVLLLFRHSEDPDHFRLKSDKTKLVQENSYCNSGDFTQIQIITFNMTSVSTFYFGISIFIPAAQRIAKPAGTFLVPRIQLLLRSPGQAPSFPNTTSSRLGP